MIEIYVVLILINSNRFSVFSRLFAQQYIQIDFQIKDSTDYHNVFRYTSNHRKEKNCLPDDSQSIFIT